MTKLAKINSARAIHDFFEYREDWYSFEEYTARIFRALGYKAEPTKKTGDGGYDIELESTDGRYGLAECKCYDAGNNVGRPELQKLAGAAATYSKPISFLFFVTTSDFSPQGLEYLDDFSRIRNGMSYTAINGEKLVSLSQQYLGSTEQIETGSNSDHGSSWQEWELTPELVRKMCPPDIYY